MLAVTNAGNCMKKKIGYHLVTLQGFVSIQKQKTHHQVWMDTHSLLGDFGIQKNYLEKMQ